MGKATRFLIFTLTLCAAAVFTTTIVRALFYNPDAEIAVPPGVHEAADPAKVPTRLVIPSLDIDADVQHVGVNTHGAMGVPSNFTDVAWYKYGVVPGAAGSAVIDGHVDNGLGLDGVFKHLADINVGDDVIVERKDGSRARFVVTSVRTYPFDAVPTDIVFNPSGFARLNLITCDGTWVRDAKTYDKRLVVFTKLAS